MNLRKATQTPNDLSAGDLHLAVGESTVTRSGLPVRTHIESGTKFSSQVSHCCNGRYYCAKEDSLGTCWQLGCDGEWYMCGGGVR